VGAGTRREEAAFILSFGVLLVATLLSTASCGGGAEAAVATTSPQTTTSMAAPAVITAARGSEARAGTPTSDEVQALAKRLSDSVVGVEVASQASSDTQAATLTSGFVYSSDGIVVANRTVLPYEGRGAASIAVVLPSGKRLEATLVGEDAASRLAVFKTNATDLLPASLSAQRAGTGDWVLTMTRAGGILLTSRGEIGTAGGSSLGVPSAQAGALLLTCPSQLLAGAVLFDTEGRLAGLVVARMAGVYVIVPSDTIASVVTRLLGK
jgi:hypothetical protein